MGGRRWDMVRIKKSQYPKGYCDVVSLSSSPQKRERKNFIVPG
jgi:hypothetical protein